MKYIAIIYALLLAGCDIQTNDSNGGSSKIPSRIDSCDLREVFGTCVEYSLNELDDWYLQYVEKACPKNRRERIVGKYKKDTSCPSANRVASCEGIIEDASEKYEYDKHYYVNTAENYSWKSANVQVTCKKVSGRFISEQ